MFAVVASDIARGTLSLNWAFISFITGTAIGLISSRIFRLSWDKSKQSVMSRIDTTGWIVLVSYIAFEIARAYVVQERISGSGMGIAITFAFVASAFLSRVYSLRIRIIKVLKQNQVLPHRHAQNG